MDLVAEGHLGFELQKVRQGIEELERHVAFQHEASAEAARRQKDWVREQISLEEEHANVFERAGEVLQQEAVRHGRMLRELGETKEEDARQRVADEAEIAEIQDAIEELRKTLEMLPAERESEEDALYSAKSKLSHRLSKLERVGRKADQEVQKLRSCVSLYERALGLIIDVTGENNDILSFRFTNLDPRDVAKEFKVSVQRDCLMQDNYRALSCSPSTPLFESLGAVFHENQDMHAFIVGMRAAFRQSVHR